MSLAEKRDLLHEPGALAVWMYAPGRRPRLIGETYGVPVQAVLAEGEPEDKEDLRPFAKRRAFYVYSTTILRKYEGRGLGRSSKPTSLVVSSRPGTDGSPVTRRKASVAPGAPPAESTPTTTT
jgi:hypothetical protein